MFVKDIAGNDYSFYMRIFCQLKYLLINMVLVFQQRKIVQGDRNGS